ncbi:MAG TPA: MutL protein [Clostridiaceae bacterium]|nr:MutL protein [Clostridiaceae bacterium]
MKPILLIDFGSTYTKVTSVDVQSEKILGTAESFTTASSDISQGLEAAVRILEQKTGKIEYEYKFACSSAAGGLKMVTIGLVPDLTAEAARRAALSAGAKVAGVFSFELDQEELDEIQVIKPDIVLLTGGTDGGNKSTILHNAEKLSVVEGDFAIVVAGNKSVASKVRDILLSSGKEVRVCQNVMPEFGKLNIEPARDAIRDLFLQRIIKAKGLTKVQQLIEGILMPTPLAVLKAVHVLSTGYHNEDGLGDILAVDVGGATTDVYSICDGKPTRAGVVMKGLPEPFAKRTVEGDLGVRYGSASLTEVVGIETIAGISGLSVEDTRCCLDEINANPGLLPGNNEKLARLDFGLSSLAIKEAVNRHAGYIQEIYTPMGLLYTQTGKDLTDVRTVIGTGGVIINSKRPLEIMKNVLYDPDTPEILKPVNADIYIDAGYILAAMGILSERYPEIAVRIIKRELEMIS